jgi:Domain of unknown function (DUF4743)
MGLANIGWRNELYPVYGANGEVLFAMERGATPLFGVVTYGVHMTVYVPPTQFQPMRIWTPKRSKKRPTYPGMLDNTVFSKDSINSRLVEVLLMESAFLIPWSKRRRKKRLSLQI